MMAFLGRPDVVFDIQCCCSGSMGDRRSRYGLLPAGTKNRKQPDTSSFDAERPGSRCVRSIWFSGLHPVIISTNCRISAWLVTAAGQLLGFGRAHGGSGSGTGIPLPRSALCSVQNAVRP